MIQLYYFPIEGYAFEKACARRRRRWLTRHRRRATEPRNAPAGIGWLA